MIFMKYEIPEGSDFIPGEVIFIKDFLINPDDCLSNNGKLKRVASIVFRSSRNDDLSYPARKDSIDEIESSICKSLSMPVILLFFMDQDEFRCYTLKNFRFYGTLHDNINLQMGQLLQLRFDLCQVKQRERFLLRDLNK